jgi:hypothetical protein
MKQIKLFSILFLFLFITSCSVQKRHYMNGYTIRWKNSNQNEGPKKTGEPAKNETDVPEPDENTITASSETDPTLALSKKIIPDLHFTKPPADSCDVIVLKNNNTIKAKISEINPATIKYKNCGDTDGPDRILSKSEISSITYSNGTKETMDNLKEENPVITPRVETQKNNPAPELSRDYNQPREPPMAKHALISGICSFIPVVGWIFAILSIIFGLITLLQIQANPGEYTGKQKALIGLILGIVGLLAGIAIVLAIFYGGAIGI